MHPNRWRFYMKRQDMRGNIFSLFEEKNLREIRESEENWEENLFEFQFDVQLNLLIDRKNWWKDLFWWTELKK